MSELNQDVYFWRLLHHLVVNEKMVAFKVTSNEKEIWLEKEDSGETMVLRIFRKNFDWSNYITRDIQRLCTHGEKVRKELKSRKLKIINVYITNYLPVDNFESQVEQIVTTKNKRVTISSFLIDIEHGNQYGILRLSQALQTYIPKLEGDDDLENQERYRKEVITISEQKLEEKRALFTYGKPFFTFILLICVLAIFTIMEYYGSSTSLLTLVEFGAKYNPLIYEGEWWRFFTAVFLHIGFLHLFMNSLALFYLGSAVERIYGTPRFIFIYLLAGVFGTISSFAFNSQVSAGASGAIFGCFGALLYFGIIHQKLFFRTIGANVIIILLINLTLGFLVPMIDNGAHIGGLVGGFLAAACLHLPKHKKKLQQLVALFVTTISLSSLLIYGFTTEKNMSQIHLINVQMSQELLQRGEIKKAYILLKDAVENDVNVVEANFLLSYSEAKLGYLKDAEKNLLITLEERPDFHEAHYNLALVYIELGKYSNSLIYIENAIDLVPENKDYYQLKKNIEKRLAENNQSYGNVSASSNG